MGKIIKSYCTVLLISSTFKVLKKVYISGQTRFLFTNISQVFYCLTTIKQQTTWDRLFLPCAYIICLIVPISNFNIHKTDPQLISISFFSSNLIRLCDSFDIFSFFDKVLFMILEHKNVFF